MTERVVSSGEIYICDFSVSANGSMQKGIRPCIVVDNKMACAFSPCIHCIPLSTKLKEKLPLHYILETDKYDCLDADSVALCEQYTLIDKSQLKDKIGEITKVDLVNIITLCKKNFPFTYE